MSKTHFGVEQKLFEKKSLTDWFEFKFFLNFLIGDAALEYSCLAFNTEQQLAGLSGVPDSKLTLWDWVKAVKLYSIGTNIKV